MRSDDFDRILSTEDQIAPSAGFAQSVMYRVTQEAAEPAPIPFPWSRALPGIGALAVVAMVAIWTNLARAAEAPAQTTVQPAWALTFAPILHVATNVGVPWIAGALVLTLVTSLASMRLASPRPPALTEALHR